jgi:hypothetical protein
MRARIWGGGWWWWHCYLFPRPPPHSRAIHASRRADKGTSGTTAHLEDRADSPSVSAARTTSPAKFMTRLGYLDISGSVFTAFFSSLNTDLPKCGVVCSRKAREGAAHHGLRWGGTGASESSQWSQTHHGSREVAVVVVVVGGGGGGGGPTNEPRSKDAIEDHAHARMHGRRTAGLNCA